MPYLAACAAHEQIDAGNAQDICQIGHFRAVAIRAVCPRVRHSASESLQTMRDEIPRIDTQLSREVCVGLDAVLAALEKNQQSHVLDCVKRQGRRRSLSIFDCQRAYAAISRQTLVIVRNGIRQSDRWASDVCSRNLMRTPVSPAPVCRAAHVDRRGTASVACTSARTAP